MKILFDNVNWASASGPNSFARRLAQQISLDGHIVADSNDYDIALVFIEETKQLNVLKPKVQRLDGIWFAPHEYQTKNKRIKECYETSDAVVFQSSFDAEMVQKWWGYPNTGTIIRNGIQLGKVEPTNATLLELRGRYEKIFVCSSNWHRQKRLKENIELFKHLRATLFPYSCLVVMGSNPDCLVSDKNIYYTDVLPHETCLEMFAAADWCIHLAWADHSPNVICEAISQGCPVICAETGGTKELVGCNGLVLKETHQYNYELFDYDNPPALDVTQVKELPVIEVNPENIDIQGVSKQYIALFESLLRK